MQNVSDTVWGWLDVLNARMAGRLRSGVLALLAIWLIHRWPLIVALVAGFGMLAIAMFLYLVWTLAGWIIQSTVIAC